MKWKEHNKGNLGENNPFKENWMITYSDMITIILCFFIVFFTLTSTKTERLEEDTKVLSEEIKTLDESKKNLEEENKSLKSLLFNEDIEDNTIDDFMDILKENNMMDLVKIDETEKGLIIRFKDGVLFPSGSASISDRGQIVLEEIGKKLERVPNSIVIEGYTDNRPIKNSAYPSNWELSVDRAIGVAKYFIENKDIDSNRISVSGYGEQRPIDTNETEEGRQNNRRIEILIMN